ncbi:MAG TPA: flagellar basal body P-ring formation chaperone FlgA [Burkholderiaceae bacterium]|nr:flagellar basal body P-ring formation chaperone FlgA [Burkholderiaceae bacterium]
MLTSVFWPRRSGWPGIRACLGLLLLLAGGARAQAPVETAPEWADATQRWLDSAVAATQASQASPLRMEISVGALDTRLRLAPCGRIEPYLPPGTRLWGKSRLGVRCMDGNARWSVFLPITIKAYGPAWVLKSHLATGAVVRAEDVVETEVDWAEELSPVMADPAQWAGQVASRPLAPGQALRQNMLKPIQVFQAGAQVRVLALGNGFSVASDGQALTPGVIGQPARVRMDNGRIMSGVVLDTRTVRLEL